MSINVSGLEYRCQVLFIFFPFMKNSDPLSFDSETQGDNGAPLVVRYNGQAFATGLVSLDLKPCDGNPTLYTRSTFYVSWIRTITGI